MVDLVTKLHGIGCRIKEIGLKAVQGLESDFDVILVQHRPDFAIRINHSFPLVLAPPRAGQVADRSVQWTSNDGRSCFRHCFNAIDEIGF